MIVTPERSKVYSNLEFRKLLFNLTRLVLLPGTPRLHPGRSHFLGILPLASMCLAATWFLLPLFLVAEVSPERSDNTSHVLLV